LQILKYNLPSADCNMKISWGATYMSVLQRDGGFVVYFRGNPEAKDTYTETYRFVFLTQVTQLTMTCNLTISSSAHLRLTTLLGIYLCTN